MFGTYGVLVAQPGRHSRFCIRRTTIIDKLQGAMTLTTDAVAQRTAIDTDGLLYLADSALGMRAGEFAKKGWPRTNIEGLRFLKKHTVDDEVRQSRPVLSVL